MQVLGDLKFLESLKLFDKENIPVPIIRKIREKYITNPDFHPSLIKNVSSACEGLCSWVRAIEVYDRVAKVTVSFLNCVWSSDVILMELSYLKRLYYGRVS